MTEEERGSDVPVEEAPVTKEKPKAKSKAKPKAKVSNMAKKAPKKTAAQKKAAAAKKAKPKKASKAEKSANKRNIDIGKGVIWPRKKVGVLFALQEAISKHKGSDDAVFTKADLSARLERMGMNDDKVNHFLKEMEEEGLTTMSQYEGDIRHYWATTAKGQKFSLPALS